MSQISLEPYLFFSGQAKEAMEFYKSIFGGDLETNPFSNMPEGTPEMPGINKEWLMHASLKGGDINLMASDSPKASPEAKKVELSLGGTDESKMRQIFDNLAVGGIVKMPLEKQFWGDYFGSLTDKFGIEWMMNIGGNLK